MRIARQEPTRILLAGLLLVLFSRPAAAQAELAWGLKGGVNVGTLDLFLPGIPVEPVWRSGLTAGVFSTHSLTGNLALRTEVLLTQKGTKFDFFGFEEAIRLTYLEIPVLGQFSIGRGGATIHASAGPSFAFKLQEKQQEDGEELDIPDEAKTFDLGLAFGGGVTWDRWIFDARYTHGLVNIADAEAIGVEGVSAKNRAFALTVGYRWR